MKVAIASGKGGTGKTMLGIGAENSGKLVAKVKNEAKRIATESGRNYIIVDGSPGVGCPVVSSLSGASFAVLVTEPTVSGMHDLKRVYELVKKFNIKAGCIINKSDLNQQITRDIESFLEEENIIHLSSLSYDDAFTKAMLRGQTIVEFSENRLKEIIVSSWEKIKEIA
jgi:MinD superfamily P-loop ATPase